MHLGIILFVFDVMFILHATKTGRTTPWAYLILALPVIGAVAYVIMELLPEWLGTYEGQKAQQRVRRAINPGKRYRELHGALEIADTVANRAALAEECASLGRHEEAFALYEGILHMACGREPVFVVGKARALFELGRAADAAATLEELRREWPDYASQEAHLLYARALEQAGRREEALHEYGELKAYYAGAEPSVRRAMLLRALGRGDEAREAAGEIVRGMKRAPAHVRRNQARWFSQARKLERA